MAGPPRPPARPPKTGGGGGVISDDLCKFMRVYAVYVGKVGKKTWVAGAARNAGRGRLFTMILYTFM